MRRFALRLAVGCAACGATPALAAGPIYFHQANIARTAFVADILECNELAGGVRTPQQPNVYTPNLIAAGAAAFFSGFFGSRERRGIIDNVLRTCMADKGYRRVVATPELKRDLGKLNEADRLDRLFALASGPTPIGKVLPR